MSLGGGGKEKKFTEYIDFFYSLHHLYKYIEPQKTNKEKLLRKKEKKKKRRNTETHNSSKANKAREERAVTEYMRGTEEQRKIGGSLRHGKRGEQQGKAESAQLCRMKIYKYVR